MNQEKFAKEVADLAFGKPFDPKSAPAKSLK